MSSSSCPFGRVGREIDQLCLAKRGTPLCRRRPSELNPAFEAQSLGNAAKLRGLHFQASLALVEEKVKTEVRVQGRLTSGP